MCSYISTNYMVIFRKFGKYKNQNYNRKLHLGSDRDLSFITTKCIKTKFIKTVQ